MGHLHGRVRVQRWDVQQLRDCPGCRSHRAGGHLPPRLPATARDAARRDREAARQDPELQARRAPAGRDRGTRSGRAAQAAACGCRHAGSGGEHVTERAEPSLPAKAGQERLAERVVRRGMFGVSGDGDTSGYGGLRVRRPRALPASRPYGSKREKHTSELQSPVHLVCRLLLEKKKTRRFNLKFMKKIKIKKNIKLQL